MKIWVIAKEGLLGRDLCEFLQKEGISFVGSAHHEVDILDKEMIEDFCEKHKPTHMINCAAYVNVDEAEGEGKERAYALNVIGPKNLVTLAKKKGIRLIHISTDYVFDGRKGSAYLETDAVHPINVYGKTKLEGEKEVLQYEKGLSFRTSSIYGPGKPGMITGMIEALKTEKEVRHISDQVSSPTYTKDIAAAIVAILDQVGIFHFTNLGEVSRYGLLVHLWHLLQKKKISLQCSRVISVTQKEAKRKAIRPEWSVLSTRKIEPFLKHPIRTWEEALREYVDTLC